MSGVEVEHLSKRYGSVVALDDVSVAFADNEMFCLLGPSGSGKTTLLRAIAGFVKPDSGTISIGGTRVEQVPVHRRGIGMVFQSYALFPHMSVYENIAFGLDVRGTPRAEVERQVEAMLELVRLPGYGARKPRELSGGQQQRVALARALVTRPEVLLLDEPLGALDRRLRQEMQVELRQIQRSVGITTIFVTHDQEEALTLSDRIAILDQGRIVQLGAPQEVYEHPRTVFAARFLGDANILAGFAEAGTVKLGDATPVQVAGLSAERKGAVRIGVRPEKLALIVGAMQIPAQLPNRVTATVTDAIYSGNSVTYRLRSILTGDEPLLAFVQNRSGLLLAPGTEVTLAWAPMHTMLLD